MAYAEDLAERVRAALATQQSFREVKMFGGLSFMVNGAMVVSVGSPGSDLLVRVDPERDEHYQQVEGARAAEMGEGRPMGPGWLAVDAAAVADDEGLAFWVAAAMEFNSMKATSGARRSTKSKTSR
ncbi:MAG: TfoX/Sxy family protein [Pseudonocardia sp.]